MRKGFTLLEILIVMAIIGVLIGVGTSGLMRLRDTMSAEQGVNQLSSYLKSEKNRAKNNVIDEGKLRANGSGVFENMRDYMLGTKLLFNADGSIDNWLCWRALADGWNLSNGSQCIEMLPVMPIGGIKFSTDLISPFERCGYVLFENLTERIYLDTPGNCKINVITDIFQNPPYRQLVFYKTLGYYEINYP